MNIIAEFTLSVYLQPNIMAAQGGDWGGGVVCQPL